MSEKSQNVALRAGGAMAFALLLSRLLGMLRDTVMFAQFDIGLATDAYQLAMLIPDMVFMLVAGGGLSSAFIPIFSDYWYKDKKEEAWRVFGSIVWATTLVSFVLVGIAWVFTPQIVDFFRDQKPATVLPPAIEMARIVLPAQIAFLVGSLLLGTLYARKSFLGPALAPNVYNVGIILGATLLPPLMGMGIQSMAWGALIGAVIGNLVLPALLMARAGSRLPLSLDLRLPGVREFFVLLLPVILGFSLPSMATIITQKYASMIGGDGINSVMRAANNLMQAPLGIFGQSLALAAFPVLAEFVARDRMGLYRDQVGKTLRTVLYLSVPASFLMAALAPEISRALYGYGASANSADQLNRIAEVLRVYCFGIFAWCLQPVLMRGFFSLKMTFLPVAIGTVATFLFIGLCEIAVRQGHAYLGLAWATNIAVFVLVIALIAALQKKVGTLDVPALLKTLAQTTFAGALAGGISFGLAQAWSPPQKVLSLVWLGLLGLGGFWVFYFVTRALKMPESDYLNRAFARLDRKKVQS